MGEVDDRSNKKEHPNKEEGKNKHNKQGRHIKKTRIKKSENKRKSREHTEAQDYELFLVSVEHNGGGRNKVVVSTNCKHVRDRNIGLYCRLGTRKVRRVKEKGESKIVCLDCDEIGKTYKDIKAKHFNELWDRKRNG